MTAASLGHPTNQNNAVSYAFGVAADEARPMGLLALDRNVNNVGSGGAAIASNVALTGTRAILNATPGPTQVVWVRGTPVHGLEGNLAYSDGSAQQVTAEALQYSLASAEAAYTSPTLTDPRLVLFP